jgi:hypothetical protein
VEGAAAPRLRQLRPDGAREPRQLGPHRVRGRATWTVRLTERIPVEAKEGNVPARIERLELATGRRTPWKVLRPTDPTGVYSTWKYPLTPDGEGYVYTYGRALNDLHLLEGLRF